MKWKFWERKQKVSEKEFGVTLTVDLPEGAKEDGDYTEDFEGSTMKIDDEYEVEVVSATVAGDKLVVRGKMLVEVPEKQD